MTWTDYSFLMFFSSVVLYLSVRKSSLIKTPTFLTNFFIFFIPTIVFLGIGLHGNHNLSPSLWQSSVILVAAVVFSYGGNTASLKSIDLAPNPGYSLIISKSYVLFTSLFALAFLHAELTWHKTIAILIIVAFSALIMINGKTKKSSNNNQWVTLAFGAFFAWGFLVLLAKYLFSHGLDTMAFLIYVSAVSSLCILVANRKKWHYIRKLNGKEWGLLGLTGISSSLFNLGNFEAIRLAPNVGYVNAMNAGSISLVTIFAVILFKDELTTKKAIGVLGVTAGICLLLI